MTLSEQPGNCFPDYTADPVLSVYGRLYSYGFLRMILTPAYKKHI